MNRILLTLMLVVLLGAASCAAPFDDAQGKPTPTATITPTLSPVLSPTPTETPTPLTATPVPTYSIEQLTAMSPADKLAMAPQAGTAPADVVASFLPKGAGVANVVWGEKTLTYWERVVSYHGKVGEQEVTLYFDLESGHCPFAEMVLTFLNFRPAGCKRRRIVQAVPGCGSVRESRA